MTDFLGIDALPLATKDLAARLPAARARSVRLASVARRSADWVREHDGARLVGRVKRSPLVQRALYRPIDREAVRPDPDDVVDGARPRWRRRSTPSSAPSGCRSASPGAGRRRSRRPARTGVQPGDAERPQVEQLVELRRHQGAGRHPHVVRRSGSHPSAARASASSSSSSKASWHRTVRTRPSRAAKAAKRCWWPSTCSLSCGSRGTHNGTCPASRASVIRPGPPWHTTADAVESSHTRWSWMMNRRPSATRRRRAQTVLDDEAHVTPPDGRGVDPFHEALERVVVGARQGDHELGHSSGPTSRASG